MVNKDVVRESKGNKRFFYNTTIDGEDMKYQKFAKLRVLPNEIEVIVDYEYLVTT